MAACAPAHRPSIARIRLACRNNIKDLDMVMSMVVNLQNQSCGMQGSQQAMPERNMRNRPSWQGLARLAAA